MYLVMNPGFILLMLISSITLLYKINRSMLSVVGDSVVLPVTHHAIATTDPPSDSIGPTLSNLSSSLTYELY
jgi:hypothetical protein